LPLDKTFWVARSKSGVSKRPYVEQPGVGIIRRRKPIGGAVNAGANQRASRGWNSTREDRAAGRVHTRGPVQLFDKGTRMQKLAVGAIENIEKTVAVCLHQKVTDRAIVFGVHQHRRFSRVKVI